MKRFLPLLTAVALVAVAFGSMWPHGFHPGL